MTRLYAIVAAVVIFAMVGVLWFVTGGRGTDDVFAACRSSKIAGGAGAIGGPFTLVNTKGETVTDRDVFTKPSIVYFGYTFCPDVCPLDSARNAEAVDLLDEDGHDVTPVFITIDPERDTPEVVGEFVDVMHEKMIGLTGTLEQTSAASKAYRTYYRKQDGDPEYYLVDHSTFSYLVLPEQGFVEFFNRDTTPEEMAKTAECFIDAS
ncbi:MAG: SCO family protein [Pseudoruegeria sp.]